MAAVGTGRGSLCGAGGAVPGGLENVAVFVSREPKARMSASVVVQVKGCKFAPGQYLNLVEEVTIEETCGLMMSMAVVKLGMADEALANDDLWEEGAEMVVETGYEETGLVRRHGKFFLSMPRAQYTGGAAQLVLVGFGEEVRLGRTEKRRAFRKRSDSQIASEIAKEHGFEEDIEATTLVHDQVLQANENDYKFLSRRALLHGFMIFVQDGVLHFHRPRPEDSGVQLVQQAGESRTLTTFDVQSKTFMRGVQWKATQVDPLKLDVIEESSTDALDDVTKAMIEGVRGPRKWADIVSHEGERPVRFMFEQGHEQQVGPIKRQVQALSESLRWVVSGAGTTYGLEQLRPNQLIEVVGVGKHSGKYFLTRVTHRVRGGAYSVEFDVSRSFTGGSEGNRCTQQVVQPVRAGVVSFV